MANSKKPTTKNIPILNGYWGIYNEFKTAPDERWDPFRTIVNKIGTKIGFHTFISPLRYERPLEYLKQTDIVQIKALEEGEDSFCHLVDGKLPAIVISKDLTANKNPLSIEPEFEDLRSSRVFSTINLYPAMPRVFPSKKYFIKKKLIKEISFVHIFSKHYLTLEEVPLEELVIYLKNIVISIKSCQEALIAENREKIAIHHFYNIGLRAGASNPHLHSQTLVHINISGYGWKNQGFLRTFEENRSSDATYCLACRYSDYVDIDPLGQDLFLRERLIWEDSHWMILTAFAPERDGQIRLLPKRHVSAIWQLKSEEIESLAKALIIANRGLSHFITEFGEKLLIRQDRNILFRQLVSNFHMLIDIIPVQQVGGAEALDDYRLSSFLPENSAKCMKDFIGFI